MATYNGHQEDSSGNVLLPIPNSMATTIETGSTASQAYTKGSYFYYNNRLVKASSAIASGATLTIGSNIAYVNAADELSAHLRANDSSRSEFYFDVKDGKYGYYPSAAKTSSTFVPFGGTFDGVEIWTNTTPSSAFNAQTLTLKSGYKFSSYRYIEFGIANSFEAHTDADIRTYIVPYSEFIQTSSGSGTWNVVLGVRMYQTYAYARRMWYVSDTSFYVSDSFRLNNGAKDNNNTIPMYVKGIK